MTECPTVVYRVHDADDRLIYIGVTGDLPTRMEFHRRFSWWNGLVGRVHATEYANRDDAFAAESVAIQEEAPVFNVMHRHEDYRDRDFADWTADDIGYCRHWIRTNPQGFRTPTTVRDFVFAASIFSKGRAA